MCCADKYTSLTGVCTAIKGATCQVCLPVNSTDEAGGQQLQTINTTLWQVERFSSGQKISWQKGEMIGAGAFGSVYTALNQDTGQLMAVKQVRPTGSSCSPSKLPSMLGHLQKRGPC